MKNSIVLLAICLLSIPVVFAQQITVDSLDVKLSNDTSLVSIFLTDNQPFQNFAYFEMEIAYDTFPDDLGAQNFYYEDTIINQSEPVITFAVLGIIPNKKCFVKISLTEEAGFLHYFFFTFTNNVTGVVNNYLLQQSLQIYPNPTTNTLTITHPGTFAVTLLNSIGEVVATGEGTEQQRMDLGNLPNGMYYYQIASNAGSRNEKVKLGKVMVQH